MAGKLKFGKYDYATFLMLISYSACSLVVPIALVNIGKELNFPLDQGGLGMGGALQLGRSFMMVLSMLFCGLIAGKVGTKKAIIIAIIVMGLSIFLSSFSPWFIFLFIMLAIAGLGEGVVEGLATPFVQDLHKNDEPGRYINISHAFWSVGVFITTIFAGWLLYLGVNWRYIVGFCGIFALTPILIMNLKSKPNSQHYVQKTKSIPTKTIWMRTKKIISIPRFWIFFAAMFFAGGGEFCLTFWCASYVQEVLNESPFVGGMATAIFALGMIIGRLCSGSFVKEKYFKHLIIFCAILGIVVGLIFPHIKIIWLFLIALFILGLASAPFWPTIQSYSDTRMRVDHTMLFVLLSCAGIPGCGFFTYLMGVVGDKIGFVESFYLVPMCYTIMGLLILADWFISPSKSGNRN